MKQSAQSKPWEQMEGEPVEAYRRFCIYLNLGPARTLEKAYSLNAKKGKKTPKISGQWSDDSARWNWVERAAYYDIEKMTEQGARVITRWIKALDLITEKALAKLESANLEPKDWKDAVDTIRLVGSFIPSESVKQLQNTVANGEQTGIGSTGDQ